MKRLAIIGTGLLGGSILRRISSFGVHHIAAWTRNPGTASRIINRGRADRVSEDLREVVHDADMIVLCVPIEAMPGIAREIAPHVSSEAFVTDVGSVKAPVVAALGEIFGGRFVGSHPMAGSQFTGYSASHPELFLNTTCIVTPESRSAPAAVTAVTRLWESLGCRVISMSAEEHDQCVALISHLPHLVAGALVRNAAAINPRSLEIPGPGFRDSTRVCSGPPDLWAGILRENSGAVIAALDGLIAKLTELRHTLAPFSAEKILSTLAEAKHTRDRINFPK